MLPHLLLTPEEEMKEHQSSQQAVPGELEDPEASSLFGTKGYLGGTAGRAAPRRGKQEDGKRFIRSL